MPIGSIAAARRRSGGGGGGGSSAVFWRIFVVDNNGDATFTKIPEVQLRGSLNGSDLTEVLNGGNFVGKAFASGDAGINTEAWRAFDSDLTAGNGWAGVGTANLWLAYKFTSSTEVRQLALLANGDSAGPPRQPRNFLVQMSSDSTNGSDGTWTTVGTFFKDNWRSDQTAFFTFTLNPTLGPELITTSPTTSGGWSVSGGNLVGVNASDRAVWPGILTSGKTYRLSLAYTYTGGSPSIARLRLWTQTSPYWFIISKPLGTSGSFTYEFLADGTDLRLEADASVFSGTIPFSTLSCKEIT